jgi:hypothetical protein
VGGDWEVIFHLGNPGFEGIQTFSWLTSDFGLSESNFGLVAIRAQVLCFGDDVLPGDKANCTGSDKAYGYPTPPQNNSVPEPGSLALLGLSVLLVAVVRIRKYRLN